MTDTLANTLPREQRLKSRSGITLLFDEGKRGFAHPVRYVVRIEPSMGDNPGEAAVMVSVPKRLHKRAHVRNLLKRRMREAYRLNKTPLREMCAQKGIRLSLGLLYTSAEVVEYSTIEYAVRKIIQSLASVD